MNKKMGQIRHSVCYQCVSGHNSDWINILLNDRISWGADFQCFRFQICIEISSPVPPTQDQDITTVDLMDKGCDVPDCKFQIFSTMPKILSIKYLQQTSNDFHEIPSNCGPISQSHQRWMHTKSIAPYGIGCIGQSININPFFSHQAIRIVKRRNQHKCMLKKKRSGRFRIFIQVGQIKVNLNGQLFFFFCQTYFTKIIAEEKIYYI